MKIDSDFSNLIKILVLGNSEVGKSNFIFRFTENKFSFNHFSSIGLNQSNRTIELENNIYQIRLTDTAGQEKYRALTKNNYLNCQGIIIIYDITSRDSFTAVTGWINSIKEICEKKPLLIIGNKIDVEKEREITFEEGKLLADKNLAMFLETSARTGINIENAIKLITKEILKSNINANDSFKLEKSRKATFTEDQGGCC